LSDVESRFLGLVEVDSGTLLIGDPCYVLPRASEGKAGVDYQAVMDIDFTEFASGIGDQPVVLLRNFGGDGSFPVFGDFVDGELVGIYINLDPPSHDDEDGDEK
jgi:hypothetical protein